MASSSSFSGNNRQLFPHELSASELEELMLHHKELTAHHLKQYTFWEAELEKRRATENESTPMEGVVVGADVSEATQAPSNDSEVTPNTDVNLTTAPAQSTHSPTGVARNGPCTFPNYDPHWFDNEGRDPVEVKEFRSRIKFSDIFIQVFQKHDTLVTTVDYRGNEGAVQATKVALEYVGSFKHDEKAYTPTFLVTTDNPAIANDYLKDCKGLKKIIQYLQSHGFSGKHLLCGKIANELYVVRGQDRLGNYDDFKHKFHIWVSEKDERAENDEVEWRKKRSKNTYTLSMVSYIRDIVDGEIVNNTPNQYRVGTENTPQGLIFRERLELVDGEIVSSTPVAYRDA